MKLALAVLFAFCLGVVTRWLDVPVPAPPRVTGVLLILAITLGYLATDRFLGRREPATAAAESPVSAAP